VRVAPALFVPPISFTFDKKAPRDRSVRRGVARAAATELELRLELELAESAVPALGAPSKGGAEQSESGVPSTTKFHVVHL
jgi:hypothetical protein